jgi:cytochrome c-type biogenesis protein CcmH/NrfG
LASGLVGDVPHWDTRGSRSKRIALSAVAKGTSAWAVQGIASNHIKETKRSMKTKSTCVAVIALALLLCGQGVVSGQTGTTGGKESQGARSQNLDALVRQAQDALDGKRWQEAIAPLQQLTAADPARWESFQQLGNTQLNLGRYEDSIQSYEKGVQAAQNLLAGPGSRLGSGRC